MTVQEQLLTKEFLDTRIKNLGSLLGLDLRINWDVSFKLQIEVHRKDKKTIELLGYGSTKNELNHAIATLEDYHYFLIRRFD